MMRIIWQVSIVLLIWTIYNRNAFSNALVARPNAVNEDNHNFAWSEPLFFIIGAPKCATTSLSDLLYTHPDICRSNYKEPQYFNHYWHMGEQFYKKRVVRNPKCQGHYVDATPDYLHSQLAASNMLQAWGPKRIKEKRLVVILRNPIAREFSWYNHLIKACIPTLRRYMYRKKQRTVSGQDALKACGSDKHCDNLCGNSTTRTMTYKRELDFLVPFDQYIRDSALLTKSNYAHNLKRWLEVFQRKQILVLNFDQLINPKNDLINVVAQHYGLEAFPSSARLPKDNTASQDPTMHTELLCSTLERLEEYYASSTEELYQLLAANNPKNPRTPLEPPFGVFPRPKCVNKILSQTEDNGEDAFNADARADAVTDHDD